MNKHDTGERFKTNWDLADKLTDADLVDGDDLPELDETFWRKAVFVPAANQQITLRIDADVVDFFRAQGPGYQRRMNAVLRRYMETQRHR